MSAFSFGHALRTTARVLLVAVTTLIPFFALPFSLDPFELPKQTLFLILVTASAVCLIGSLTFTREVSIRVSLFMFPALLLLVTTALSASFSSAPYLSWFGVQGQTVSTVTTLAACVLYSMCLLHACSEERMRTRLFSGWMLGAGLSVSLGILWFFGVYPLRVLGIEAISGNPVGTMNALGCLAASLAAAGSAFWVTTPPGKQTRLLRAESLVALFLSFFFLACVDYPITWWMFLLGQICVLAAVFIRTDRAVHPRRLFPVFFLVAVAVPFLLFFRLPFAKMLPADVTPNASLSLEIATDAVARDPWFGSGPNTYQIVYSAHHSSSVNATPFWDIHFDRASSYVLTLLSTVGVISFGMWILLAISGCVGVLFLLRSRAELTGSDLAAASVFLVLLLAALLYPFTITLLIAFFFVYPSLLLPFARDYHISHADTPRRHTFFVAGTVIGILLLLFLLFVSVQRLVSEAAFASAIRADRQRESLQVVISALDRSVSLNRFDDGHYRVLSEALLLRAGEELARLNAAPSATDLEKTYVQALIGAAVNASVRATELSPSIGANWLTRGRVYRELIGFSGKEAEVFARQAFARAHALEPQSPVPLFESGVTERVIADQALRLVSEEGGGEPERIVEESLARSEQFFLDALALKPDHAPSVFQLSLVYERQGKLNQAISTIERITIQSPNDLGALFELGVLYLRRGEEGDATRAKRAFSESLVLAPSFSNARWFLASALEREGKREEAISALYEILRYEPENQIVKNRIERLKTTTIVEPITEPLP